MLLLSLLIFGAISTLTHSQAPVSDKGARHNLDLPPEQRWQQVAQEKQHAIAGIILEFKRFLMEWGSGEIISLVELLGLCIFKHDIGVFSKLSSGVDAESITMGKPGIFKKHLIGFKPHPFSSIMKAHDNMDDALPSPYKEELRGMANTTGINVGELFIYNIFYELFSVCTSIVAHDKNGKMFHARNLDFGLFLGWDTKNKSWELTSALRPALVNLDWQRGGKTVFKSVNYAGYIGVLTAVKQGKFTFSMDERFVGDGGYLGILEWIRDKKGSWMGFLSRETMENIDTFDEARDKLAYTQMIAPAYFILGGSKPGEGVVITRNREVNGTDIWPMTDKTAGGWYVLETNYDHWKAPLILDDRRDPANKCMQQMTSANVGIPGLFDVLSSKPVLNKLTTYSALMQVDSGHLESWLQYCPDPCDPW